MSDGSNEALVGLHVASYETIVLDCVRKLAESYTRISILERALNETRQKRDELQSLYDSTQVSLQHAINGLGALKGERDSILADLQVHQKYLEEHKISEGEFERLTNELIACKSDSETLKGNYKAVVNKLGETSRPKSIKTKSVTTDECLDDNEVPT